jgi:hypothetical protein
MEGDKQKDPERRGVAVDNVAVETEAVASGERAGELQVDPRVVFPIAKRVDEP